MNEVSHPSRQVIAASPVSVLDFTPALEPVIEGVVATCEDRAAPDLDTDTPVDWEAPAGVPLGELDWDIEPVRVGVAPAWDAITDFETVREDEGDLEAAATPETVDDTVLDSELDEATTAFDLDPEEVTTEEAATTCEEAATTCEEAAAFVIESVLERVLEREIVGGLDFVMEGLGRVPDSVSELETLRVITIVPVMKLWTLQW